MKQIRRGQDSVWIFDPGVVQVGAALCDRAASGRLAGHHSTALEDIDDQRQLVVRCQSDAADLGDHRSER